MQKQENTIRPKTGSTFAHSAGNLASCESSSAGRPLTVLRLTRVLGALSIALLSTAAQAELIPASRLTDWTPGVTVGVPGGVDQYLAGGGKQRTNQIDVTKSPYLADNTGQSDARGAIQSAINAAKPGDVVYLPAGKYRIDSMLMVGNAQSNVTLRGAGWETIIDCRTSNYGIHIGTAYEFNWPASGNTLSPATLTKGATSLQIADTSAFSVGQLVLVSLGNDAALPVVSVFGYDVRPADKQWQGMRRQLTRITGKTSNSLTIFPALYGDYTGAPNAKVTTSQVHTTGVGVEDMMIDCSNGSTTFPVGFNTAYGCWAKNVKVQFSNNYGFYIAESLNCEIRQCWVDQAKGQGSTSHCGILVDTGVGCLIEDNVIAHNFPSMMINHGSAGNVVAYNFCYDSTAYGVSGVSINTNHGPHNSFNLYEGNVAPNVQCDGYFGGASHDTLFRNWLHGTQPGISTPAWTVSLNRFTRNYSIVGNILGSTGSTSDGVSLGNPNMGNGFSTGEGPPWAEHWVDGSGTLSQTDNVVRTSSPMFSAKHVGWFILTPATSTYVRIESYIDPQQVTVNAARSLSGLNYVVAPGPSGYQELDKGVAATLLRAKNYDFSTGSIPAGDAVPDELPVSLYRKTAPSWFGSLPWPAFDPLAPKPRLESIPAGQRYFSGSPATPTTPIADSTAQRPFNVRLK